MRGMAVAGCKTDCERRTISMSVEMEQPGALSLDKLRTGKQESLKPGNLQEVESFQLPGNILASTQARAGSRLSWFPFLSLSNDKAPCYSRIENLLCRKQGQALLIISSVPSYCPLLDPHQIDFSNPCQTDFQCHIHCFQPNLPFLRHSMLVFLPLSLI